MPADFWTVSQLNGHIKEVLNMGFPSSVWVCGEVQGFNRNKDRSHVFFELCEKDPVTKDIVARAGLVIFSGRKVFIQQALASAQNAFELKDDIEVKFLCKVDFYPPHGAVRLIVESIDPVYTLGKIAQEKQRLIALLKSKGVLDKNKNLELPAVPLRIGLISAFDSAAYNDFLSELRSSGFGFQVYFRGALMQGRSAPADVCAALDDLSKIDDLDAIVITRGGGSIAELSCFDHQGIAEKIAACGLPVLSGIGHEINITITDLASHTYQKTPTAIAAFLAQKVRDFLVLLDDKAAALIDLCERDLDGALEDLKNNAQRLSQGTTAYLQDHNAGLTRRQEQLRQLPQKFLQHAQLKVHASESTFSKDIAQRFKAEHFRMQNFVRLIDMAKPQNTLKRGFSVTRTAQGQLLRSVRQARNNEGLLTQVSDGIVHSVIRGTDKEADSDGY